MKKKSIQVVFCKQTNQAKSDYQTQLNVSADPIGWIFWLRHCIQIISTNKEL